MIKDILKKYWIVILSIIIFSIVQANLILMLPEYMSDIVSSGIVQGNMDKIYELGIIMLIIALTSATFALIISYISSKFGASLAKFIREKIFRKVTYLSRGTYKTFQTSSLITRSTNDINQVQMVATMVFRMVTFSLMMGIGGVIKAIVKAEGMTSLTTVIIVGVAAILGLLIIMILIVLPKFDKVQKLLDKINSKTRETLNGILVIRAFNQEKSEEKKFNKINTDYAKLEQFINRAMSLLNPYIGLVMNGVSLGIIWVVSYQAKDIVAIANMLAFMQYTVQIIMSFLMICMLFVFIPRAKVSYDRIVEVLNKNETSKHTPTKEIKNPQGELIFNNVSFKYPDAEEYILKNINFKATPGTITAFIGSTGSGKSTIASLIPKLYEIEDGEILLDGININDITDDSLRDNIGYVPQKANLFSGTIESNLSLGNKNYKQNELKKALIDAELNNFEITKEVSQGGTNLSGGQRQRVSIARALVKKPKILLFDDSFSALDFKTDSKIRTKLKKEYTDSTILIVAQRIGTILNADNIIVLDKGEIEAQGTHEELQKKSKVYKEILLSQYGKERI